MTKRKGILNVGLDVRKLVQGQTNSRFTASKVENKRPTVTSGSILIDVTKKFT